VRKHIEAAYCTNNYIVHIFQLYDLVIMLVKRTMEYYGIYIFVKHVLPHIFV